MEHYNKINAVSEERKYTSVSIVVTSIAFDAEVKGMLSSFEQAVGNENHELIVVLKDSAKIDRTPSNIKIIICTGRSRCFRKDVGAENATHRLLCFMDSDCRLPVDYFQKLASFERMSKVVRGTVKYLHDGSYFGRSQSEYRRLCDDTYFRLETFTPNLIIEKDLFLSVGGFDENNNIDAQDDYILSEKVRAVFKTLQWADTLAVDCIPDDTIARTFRSWFGYGVGYGFRSWKFRGIDRHHVWKFPPLVLHEGVFSAALPILLLQCVVCWAGFMVGLVRYRGVQRYEPNSYCQTRQSSNLRLGRVELSDTHQS
jgi:glycosyltransferase involved in cell wall biosynthesis